MKYIITICSLLCISILGKSQSLEQTVRPANIEEIICRKLELSPQEGQSFRVLSEHRSTASGIYHIYAQEHFLGLPVFESLVDIHLNDTQEVVSYNDELQHLDYEKEGVDVSFDIDNQYFIPIGGLCGILFPETDPTILLPPVVQQEARLGWWPYDQLTLATETIFEYNNKLWQVIYEQPTHKVLKLRALTVSCDFSSGENCDHQTIDQSLNFKDKIENKTISSTTAAGVFAGQYNYFTTGVPSPLYGNRTLESANTLVDPGAAPHGWHDSDGNAATIEYPYTKGNHVYAYYAPIGTGAEPLTVPILRDPISGNYLSGNVPPALDGELDFNYMSDLTDNNPLAYLEDAIINLFVWNNLCHDILYQHGFDEAAGNFQAINYDGAGAAGDEVLARAQDGSGVNNASFSTPVDGLNPTMRMFLWDTELEGDFRDANFENVIIAHEYAHGLSFRLVGGANNVSCLGNFEQGGEGWSDFIGLLLTIDADNDGVVEESALGEGVRSIGNYVLKQTAGDTGIRSRFYSTNMDCPSSTCNDLTYDQLTQLQAPHGVGTLWATMLWDMAWALINKYGFEPNWQLTNSTAGNIRALKIVIEAMKLTACSPSFPNMRDKVMVANNALYGSDDEELLWEVFARRGLGVDAAQGGIASFDTPTVKIESTVDNEMAQIGETVTYNLTITNNTGQALSQVNITDELDENLMVTNGQISNGGTLLGNTIVWPTISLPVGASTTRTFTGTISAEEGSTVELYDPVEEITGAFIPLGDWILDGGQTNPATGSTTAWFQPSLPLLMESSLLLRIEPTAAADKLVFWQWFDLESGIDGGVIEIQNGGSWTDLGSRIRELPYNGFMYDALPTPIGVPVPFSPLSGRSGYTDYSDGWRRTVIDLSGYTGEQTIRFRFGADESTDTGECNGPGNACAGWYLDDFYLLDMRSVLNEACVTSAQGYASCDDVGVGTIYFAEGALPVDWLLVEATGRDEDILVHWKTVENGTNRGFWLERSTLDAPQWERLKWIPASTATGNNDYEYSDREVQKGQRYYYRLYQEDYDGSFAYSQIVSALLGAKEGIDFSIYPNPGQEQLNIVPGVPVSTGVHLQIRDTYGRIWWEQSFEHAAEILTDSWPSGCYYLHFTADNSKLVSKWIKS